MKLRSFSPSETAAARLERSCEGRAPVWRALTAWRYRRRSSFRRRKGNVAVHQARELAGSPLRNPLAPGRMPPSATAPGRPGKAARNRAAYPRQLADASAWNRRAAFPFLSAAGFVGAPANGTDQAYQATSRMCRTFPAGCRTARRAALPTEACGCVRSPASSTQAAGAEAPAPVIAVGHRRPRFPEAACPRQGASRRAAIFGSARQS